MSVSWRCRSKNGIAVETRATADDDQLVAAAKTGDRVAFGELARRHHDQAFHTTLRITRNREDAEDAVQEAFVSALTHLESFDGRSRFSTLLMRIAINAALMKLRKNRTLREVPMDEPRDDGEKETRREVAETAASPEESHVRGRTWRFWEKPSASCDLRCAIRSRRTIESMGRYRHC